MACLTPYFFAPAVTKIQNYYAACKKFFGGPIQVSPVSDPSPTLPNMDAVSVEEKPEEVPIQTSLICADDLKIKPIPKDVIIQQPSTANIVKKTVRFTHTDDKPIAATRPSITADSKTPIPKTDATKRSLQATTTSRPMQSGSSRKKKNLPSKASKNVAVANPNHHAATKAKPSKGPVPVAVVGDLSTASKPWIVDVSWDTCNPASRTIYYEVSAKAGYFAGFGQYVVVGPYNPALAPDEFVETELPANNPLAITVSKMREAGFRVLVGKWLVLGSPVTILFDVDQAIGLASMSLEMIHGNFPVKINAVDNLARYGIVLGFMTATFLNILKSVLLEQAATDKSLPANVVAHFHEWTTASGILLMKAGNLAKGVATAYTPHESPAESFDRTGCIADWIKHRELIDSLAKKTADRFIERLPEQVDKIDSVYKAAIVSCQNKPTIIYYQGKVPV